MNKEEQLKLREEAFNEDRERFFKVADTLDKQPKYEEHLEELEQLKQKWRDAPDDKNFPNITHPIELPEWFPKVYFASNFKKDEFEENFINEMIDAPINMLDEVQPFDEATYEPDYYEQFEEE